VRKQCILSILEDGDNSMKHWVLGVPFLRGYYIMHDMEKRELGLLERMPMWASLPLLSEVTFSKEGGD
jgi:hypothetical protein